MDWDEELPVREPMRSKRDTYRSFRAAQHRREYQRATEPAPEQPWRSIPKKIRQSVYGRDKRQCRYCGEKLTRKNRTIDHVVPKAQGGTDHFHNLVSACRPCNESKADKTPAQAGMELRPIPVVKGGRHEDSTEEGRHNDAADEQSDRHRRDGREGWGSRRYLRDTALARGRGSD